MLLRASKAEEKKLRPIGRKGGGCCLETVGPSRLCNWKHADVTLEETGTWNMDHDVHASPSITVACNFRKAITLGWTTTQRAHG